LDWPDSVPEPMDMPGPEPVVQPVLVGHGKKAGRPRALIMFEHDAARNAKSQNRW